MFSAILTDVIVILTSAAACFYCIALRRKIAALVAAESPIAASIASLQEARVEVDEVKNAQRKGAVEASEALQASIRETRTLVREAKALRERLEAVIDEYREWEAERAEKPEDPVGSGEGIRTGEALQPESRPPSAEGEEKINGHAGPPMAQRGATLAQRARAMNGAHDPAKRSKA
jgi:hypothetical protein